MASSFFLEFYYDIIIKKSGENMEKEYLDTVIEITTQEINRCLEEKKKDNNDYNRGIIVGMYYVADSLMDAIKIQNDVNDTNDYTEFIKLVEDLEKKLD